MAKEYKTIREIAGPLMLVSGVRDVSFNELGEIILASGEKKRCRVLEIDGEIYHLDGSIYDSEIEQDINDKDINPDDEDNEDAKEEKNDDADNSEYDNYDSDYTSYDY